MNNLEDLDDIIEENEDAVDLESEDNDETITDYEENLFYTDKIDNNSEEDNLIVNKNQINIIKNEKRKSIPILTKYEITRIICIRSSQIENGAKPCIEINSKMNPIHIAKHELLLGESPLILRRRIYDNYYEEWKIKELKIINKDFINNLIL